MMNRKVEYAWLQISDLHIFDDKTTDWNLLKMQIRKIPNIDFVKFIVITGDLHQYGDDYKKTIYFLNQLLEIMNLKKDSIFIVPGNHDSENVIGDDEKSSTKDAYTTTIAQKVEENQDIYQNYFTEKRLGSCFDKYCSFIREFYGKENPYNDPKQVCVKKWINKDNPNIGINLVHLNSAINCNNVKNEKCIIDINKLSSLPDDLFDFRWPTMILAHHPFDKLFKSHQDSLRRLIDNWNVCVYLCGDEHKEFIVNIKSNKSVINTIPCIVCGKIYPELEDNYSDIGLILYQKYEFDKKIYVYPYLWDSNKKNFLPYIQLNTDEGNPTFDFEVKKNLEDSKNSDNFIYDNNNSILDKGESIWLPDAEKAKGKQTRFNSFTRTKIIDNFLEDNTEHWGISAVKGTGKTFVLQVKRANIKKDNRLCLPLGIKPSVNNEWGTDTINFKYIARKTGLRKLENITKLWIYCIIAYAINQLCNIKKFLKSEASWKTLNFKKEILNTLEKYSERKLLCEETVDLCTNEDYLDLNSIMNATLTNNAWSRTISNDLNILLLLNGKVNNILGKMGKNHITIFIDKVDQAILQTGAEKPKECVDCVKIKELSKMNYSLIKSEELENPCLNCSIEEEEEGRIYHDNSRYEHVSMWQYLQLGLLKAVNSIKEVFKGTIEVYFTIREEAFACEDGMFGENKRKITDIIQPLYYEKNEQKRIFLECIREQRDEFLFEPRLKNKEGRQEEAFLGVDKLCHPYVKENPESVFDCIYRHSFDRSRDIQDFGQMLTEKLPELRSISDKFKRGQAIKTYIENKAAELAFTANESHDSQKMCYYDEKCKLLPNFWTERNNFRDLILRFDKNLLFYDEAQKNCREFNHINRCTEECIKCDAAYHPFSMLYKLGMLGQINTNEGYVEFCQKFVDSKDVTYIMGIDTISINKNTIYVLHPALTKSIEKFHEQILHFNGFIIGKGLKVSREKIKELNEFYKENSFDDYQKHYFSNKKSF